jgi:hypothetical protein
MRMSTRYHRADTIVKSDQKSRGQEEGDITHNTIWIDAVYKGKVDLLDLWEVFQLRVRKTDPIRPSVADQNGH